MKAKRDTVLLPDSGVTPLTFKSDLINWRQHLWQLVMSFLRVGPLTTEKHRFGECGDNPVIFPTLTYRAFITTGHFLTPRGIRLDGAISPLG